MQIENMNDQHNIEIAMRDINAMSKAIASLKRTQTLAKKVKKALASGRIDDEKANDLLSSIHSSMTNDLLIIQERGLGLGSGDLGSDHEESAVNLAQHILNTIK
jgi:3-hydroxyacyl-CoA dehydrogenase